MPSILCAKAERILFSALGFADTIPIRKNEVYKSCTSRCPLTCENYKNLPMCIASCGPAGWQCEPNYVRKLDGKCVLPSECDRILIKSERLGEVPIREHEVYRDCTSNCPLTCENYKNPPMCIASCGPPGWQCEPNYVRKLDGKCVTSSEC